MAKMIDPPSGWRYGFPKEYDNPDNLPMYEWLVANGYPQEEIDVWGDTGMWVRFIFDSDTEFKRGI